MLKAKEFIERGADVVLRNLLTDDTTEFQTERPTYFHRGIDLTDHMVKGHTYYFRVTTRKTVEGFSDVASTATLGSPMVLFAHTSNSSTSYYFNWNSTFDTDGYSGLYTFTGFKGEGGFWIGNPSVFRDAEDIENDPESKSGSFGLFYKEWMAIDISVIYTMYPSFAGLSAAEQKAVLDEIPYFIGYTRFSYEDSLVNDKTYSSFEKSIVRAVNFLEGPAREGMDVYKNDPFFDLETTTISKYNNSSTATPVLTKITAPDDYPLKDVHPTVYKLSFDRTIESTPGLGGYICFFTPNKTGTFEDVFYVKAPKGLRMYVASNYTASNIELLNSDTTGEWQEGHIKFDVTGKEGRNGGHVYFFIISGADVPEQFDVYLGAATVLDITDNPDFFYTPLFDPSLGARMTPRGLLHSGAFIEDSAISSVQVSRGGVRRIPEITLHNRVTEDTSAETTVTNNGYPAVQFSYDDTTVVGRRYYLRARVKYMESNRNFNQLWLWLKTGNSDTPARIYIYSNQLADIGEYNLISGVAYTDVKNFGLFNSGAIYWGPSPTETDPTMTTVYKHVMCIDLTDLYAAFPSFAELSDADQTAILDTLPYFHGDLTLGGALTNLVSNANNIEGEWVAGTPETYNNRRINLSRTIEIWSASVYSRCDMKYVKLDSEAEDYDWMAYYWGSGTYESHTLKDVRPDVEYLNVSGIEYHKTPSALERVNYGYMFGGYQNNVFGKQMFSRNVICIDLGTHGHYTLYRLLGMTDADIKAHLDSLPFFQKSIPFPTLIDDQKKLY